MESSRPGAIRLADLLDTLTMAVDLGLGQPMGHVARSALIAARMTELVDLDASARADLVAVTRLGWLGCIADSRQAAAWFGDDIAYRAGVYDLDLKPLPFLGYLLQHAGADDNQLRRTSKRIGVLLDAGRSTRESLRAHCQVTSRIAQRLGFGTRVCDALGQIFARWDGKGLPTGVAGDQIALVVRLWHVADVAEVHHRRGGLEAVTHVLRARAGTQFDPQLVETFCAHSGDLLAAGDAGWEFARSAAPNLYRPLTDAEFDVVLATMGDWVDLKSACFSGHSRGVAELAEAAARHIGLDRDTCTAVRRAGFVHDLGRTGVSNQVWDKAGPLTASERERIRLHSYYTERMLAESPPLASIGRIAAMTHEHLDGSGYHRGVGAAAIPVTARVLAAADTFHTKLEPRPHRDRLDVEQAAHHLAAEVHLGHLDKAACDAVLSAAGQPRTVAPGPAGLTDREVDVLALVASGLTNRQIARQLSISPKTVNNHVEHVYAKAQVGTRAAATLFAMEHGLVNPRTGGPT